jgi:hypothetical protein
MDVYTKSHKEHWLRDKRDDGRILVLEDGSWWEVRASDRIRTSRWYRISTITVEDPKQGGHSYLLTNTMERETAQANYIGKPSDAATIPEEAA